VREVAKTQLAHVALPARVQTLKTLLEGQRDLTADPLSVQQVKKQVLSVC